MTSEPGGGLKSSLPEVRLHRASMLGSRVFVLHYLVLLQTYSEYYHGTIAPCYVPAPTKIAVFVDVAIIHP